MVFQSVHTANDRAVHAGAKEGGAVSIATTPQLSAAHTAKYGVRVVSIAVTMILKKVGVLNRGREKVVKFDRHPQQQDLLGRPVGPLLREVVQPVEVRAQRVPRVAWGVQRVGLNVLQRVGKSKRTTH